MTQLFDTKSYDHTDQAEATVTNSPLNEGWSDGRRHLRSIPVGDLADRKAEWRLDPQTIEVGRKGIQAARQALQDAAAARSTDQAAKPTRKAA